MADQLDCALDLLRRLPPATVEDNLAGVIDLVPDLMDDLLATVDQPLKIAHDNAAKRDYLLCDYNRDGDSYRSPWSNKYDPPLGDGAVPPQKLRNLEIQLNDVFDIYREMYPLAPSSFPFLLSLHSFVFSLFVLSICSLYLFSLSVLSICSPCLFFIGCWSILGCSPTLCFLPNPLLAQRSDKVG